MLPYFLALVLAVILQFTELGIITDPKIAISYQKIVPLAIIGTFVVFSMMTMGAVYLLAIPSDVFGFIIFPVMLIERTIAVVLSSVVAAIVLGAFGQEFQPLS